MDARRPEYKLLLIQVQAVSCRFFDAYGAVSSGAPAGLSFGSTHDDWILEESRRRYEYPLFPL